MKNKKLVIFGDRTFAEIAYEYFTHDSPYEVVAFTADKAYIKEEKKFGLPVVPFEEIEKLYPPASHEMYAAIVYGELNRVREKTCTKIKQKGYKLASYISSRAFLWRNVKIGGHCFIFEDNTVQPFVEIGDNVVLWSGNHIGHHSKIGANNFISSHVVISGHCEIGEHCFLGVNATIGNGVEIGSDSWISPGALITRDVPAHSLVKTVKSEVDKLDEEALFRKLKDYTT